ADSARALPRRRPSAGQMRRRWATVATSRRIVPKAPWASARFPRKESTYTGGMCRNIRTLYNFEPATTPEEIHAAAEQFVRKVSGMNKPSQANAAAFERAID